MLAGFGVRFAEDIEALQPEQLEAFIPRAQEHEAFLSELQVRDADSVELEMGPLVQGLGSTRGRIRLSLIGYYSDIPGKEGATLADAKLGANPRILRAKDEMATYMLGHI